MPLRIDRIQDKNHCSTKIDCAEKYTVAWLCCNFTINRDITIIWCALPSHLFSCAHESVRKYCKLKERHSNIVNLWHNSQHHKKTTWALSLSISTSIKPLRPTLLKSKGASPWTMPLSMQILYNNWWFWRQKTFNSISKMSEGMPTWMGSTLLLDKFCCLLEKI